ncbi:nucleotidyltransferase domain-containing protein [Dethiobacter alkaliphilus]|uniref:nucleotidyltransferase domain-containing protein n=1 Tax=Dethiobacter alkaliphilus TaxID=427926 RepID=UPI002226A81B|nr:nucleotidyltransferase [Dethiobacter alkaliphilus]MCW3491339.1 nucleotidyltransferase [Dethiobacter alkaliphilus]
MSTYERQGDILKIISQLDITPTMYKNAVTKYTSIAEYLENNGIEADMYPQGSFALGTVVRPNAKDPNAAYDLDFICQLRIIRTYLTAAELRKNVEDILMSSDLYGGKLTINDNCFTIKYADVGGLGFSIDIVPAVDENEENKVRLRSKSKNPTLIDSAIAIPKKCEKNYNWITNNPKGYRRWFENINAPFQDSSRMQYRQVLFEENKPIYASVEEIPVELERSAMQRVIQILKYHRDMYYSKLENGDDVKPISAIINTIVAHISASAPANISVFDLLNYVLGEFATYAEYQTLTEERFAELYQGKNVIGRKSGKWFIENPANPEDNLADQWNQDGSIPAHFFAWAKVVREDLIDSLQMSNEDFRARAETAFGQKAVASAWGNKYNNVAPKPVSPVTPAKPWREKWFLP